MNYRTKNVLTEAASIGCFIYVVASVVFTASTIMLFIRKKLQ